MSKTDLDVLFADPYGWVDNNIDMIKGWATRNCRARIELPDLRHEAYIVAISALAVCRRKKYRTIEEYRAVFFWEMRSTLLAPTAIEVSFHDLPVKTGEIEITGMDESDFYDRYSMVDASGREVGGIDAVAIMDQIEELWPELCKDSELSSEEEVLLAAAVGVTNRGVTSCREAEGIVGRKKSYVARETSKALRKLRRAVRERPEFQHLLSVEEPAAVDTIAGEESLDETPPDDPSFEHAVGEYPGDKTPERQASPFEQNPGATPFL